MGSLETQNLIFGCLGWGWLEEGLCPVSVLQGRSLSLEESNPGAFLLSENLPKEQEAFLHCLFI